MAERVVVDPVTRIEGSLKIEVEIENGKVKEAWSSCQLFRGIEIILKGRDPRDAWHITQRICGVCPEPHGTASVLSMEDSFDVRPPEAGRIIRNLLLGSNYLHSHILHFYHLTALDFVDVVDALNAKPSDSYLKEVHTKLNSYVESGQLGPFANGYWGHPQYKLPSEVNLLAVAHYLEALQMQAKASNMEAIFGGIQPHQKGMVAGGVAGRPTLNDLKEFKYRLHEVADWIENVYLQDVLAVAPFYLDWAAIGGGYGNFHSFGVFPDKSWDPVKQLLPRGAILDGKITEVMDNKPEEITEYVKYAWFTDESGGMNPKDGKTEPDYTGYDVKDKYTWSKAPRWKDKPVEAGPLARMAVAYGRGDKVAVELIDSTLKALGVEGKPEVLVSTLGRNAARMLETVMVARAMKEWIDELIELAKEDKFETYESYELPDEAEGVGLTEAPRGSLGHWNSIKDGKIENYQVVAASIWNFGPRDDEDQRGPVEEALIGTPVEDPKQPLEIIRVVHGFDP